MSKKIIFCAGGTGGHIFPATNLMNHLYEKKYEVILVTDKRGSAFLNKQSKFKSYELKIGSLTNKNLYNKILSLILIFFSLIKSIIILKKEKADLVIGFGGYTSFPTSIASKFFNLPLVIYEPNIIFGRSNKYLLPFASKIFISKKIENKLHDKYKNKIHITGPILNKNIINYSKNKKNKVKENFSILVLGGSQGAEIFGNIIPQTINMLKNQGFKIEVNQQCVPKQKDFIINYYKKKNIDSYVFEFDSNILNLILSADLAITRSGASSIAELACTNTPFIAVPLPNSIDNHQYLNAKFYEEKKCCWIINQKDFNEENLFNFFMKIIKDKSKLKEMQKNMEKSYINDTYSVIESQIKDII
tara:strand:- start:46 stop:1125 length:1080 start_codon:yes stop_codon:yes gene_type:complete